MTPATKRTGFIALVITAIGSIIGLTPTGSSTKGSEHIQPPSTLLTGINGTNADDFYADPLAAELMEAQGSYVLRFRADKWEGPVPVEELDKFIGFIGQNQVVYDFSLDATPEQNIEGLSYLIEHGVNVIGVEFGNEEYAGQNFNFSWTAFEAAFTPHLLSLIAYNPNLPKAFWMCPRPTGFPGGRSEQETWNQALKNWIATKDDTYVIDLHIYYNIHDAAQMGVTFPTEIYTGQYNAAIDDWYKQLYLQIEAYDSWEEARTYCTNMFPGRKVWITEFGPTSATGDRQNTWGYHAAEFLVRHRGREYFDMVLKHNGISPTNTGMISPATNKDTGAKDVLTARLSYYTSQLFNEAPTAYSTDYTIAAPGTYYFWYINTSDGNFDMASVVPAEYLLATAETHYVQGSHWYSSVGDAPYMDKGSIASRDISGIITQPNSIFPPLSYGYCKITVNEREPEPCTQPRWCQWRKKPSPKCPCNE